MTGYLYMDVAIQFVESNHHIFELLFCFSNVNSELMRKLAICLLKDDNLILLMGLLILFLLSMPF